MANLDLVVSSIASAAHLAGALGRPVFPALRGVADWRWLTGRDDTPWYPSHAAVPPGRRPAIGEPVFERIAAAVREKLSQSGA